MKRIFLWVVIIAIIGLALIGLGRLANKSGAEGDLSMPVSEKDWSKGAGTKVTIVEYSDFQCPACGSYYPIIKQVVADRGADVKFVYRHFPLQQHQYAQLAAVVAEAAGRQGKFWEMHDMLFAKQNEWSKSTNATALFLSYVQTLGLDLTKFQQDIEDEAIRDKVLADYRSGVKSGVQGTPTFFINGKQIDNPGSYEGFLAAINAAMATGTTTNATSTATTTGGSR